MSSQTLTLICLACHIMAKRSPLTKNNTSASIKYKVIKTNQLTPSVNKKSHLIPKPISKNHAEK